MDSMKLMTAIARAYKQLKKEEAETQAVKLLSDNPITVELIAKIAVDYDYHFEIVQKDGTILRFTKKGVQLNGVQGDDSW